MIGEKQLSPGLTEDAMKRHQTNAKVQRAAWLIAVAGLIAAAGLIPGQALPIASAVGIYFLLVVVFRLAGKRTIANLTTFDLILLLIISEATQQAMVRDNNSFTNAALLVVTLVVIDVGMSLLKLKFPKIEQLLEGEPLVVVEEGKPLKDRMELARIDEEDVLSVARQTRGIDQLAGIRLAVLESGGGISIIPHSNQNNHTKSTREVDST